MLPHGGDEHRVGQGQKFVLKIPHHHRRIFHQEGVLFQQARVGHHLTLDPGCGPGQFLREQGPAGRRVHDDPGRLEGRHISLGIRDLHGLGRQEAVAPGGPAAGHIAHLEGHHRAPVAGQDPVDRPGKGDGFGPPAHGLGEAQPQDKRRQEFRQALGGGPPGGALLYRQVDAPGRVHFDEVRDRHALGLGKTQGRGRGLARRVKGHGLGGASSWVTLAWARPPPGPPTPGDGGCPR